MKIIWFYCVILVGWKKGSRPSLLERIKYCLYLCEPLIDGIFLELFNEPSPCGLYNLKLGASSLHESVSWLQNNGPFVNLLFIVLDHPVGEQFERASLAHEQPVYLLHITFLDRLVFLYLRFWFFLYFFRLFLLQERFWEQMLWCIHWKLPSRPCLAVDWLKIRMFAESIEVIWGSWCARA